MNHASAANSVPMNATAAPGDFTFPVPWPLLIGIAAATLGACLTATLLPCSCLRFFASRAAAADAADATGAINSSEEIRKRQERRRSRLAFITSCLTSLGAGVILSMVFIGLMPAAESAYRQLCPSGSQGATCQAAGTLVPQAGCLVCCLLLWLARSLVEYVRERRSQNDETKPLVAAGGSNEPSSPKGAAAEGCCPDAPTPEALQDSTTAWLVTSTLMLKAAVEGLALPSMLRVASPLFVALSKCFHEAFCGLVVGLAWYEASGPVRAGISPWGIVAFTAYAVAASGSILLGGLTASLQTRAGAGVQFGLLILAAGAGLQATFLHILPRLHRGPSVPALVLTGTVVMTLVGALHHLIGGGHAH